jgi:hypothetical protein
MKLAIMQPYFLPYIGYFQLISAVDRFVIYDNIKYTKKGWINRNRMLQNNQDKVFSLSLAKASDQLDIVDRRLSTNFNRQKLLNQIRGAYSKAPYFNDVWPLIEKIVFFEDNNLFIYIQYSISEICKYLELDTEILVSSDVDVDHDLQGEERVISICKKMEASIYINPIGGKNIYSNDIFTEQELELKFLQSQFYEYQQFQGEFVPWLSILDIIMFNSLEKCRCLIKKYDLMGG